MPGRSGHSPSNHPPEGEQRAKPLRVVTTDLWYTVIYLRPADQRRMDRARDSIWAAPLERAGWTDSRTRAHLRQLDEWATDLEARGRTPSILQQARQLERLAHVPIPGARIAEELDALIARGPVQVAPGARRALARLKEAGLRLALVSNLLHETGRGARELLDSLGILHEYSMLVFSDEHPWSKPGPEPFRFALSRLGFGADRAAHIGDLSYDLIGANRAGMRAFLYTGLHRLEPPRLRELARAAAPAADRVARWSEFPARVLGNR